MSESSTPVAAAGSDAAHAGVEDPVFTLFAVLRVSSSHPVTLDGHDVPGSVQELEDIASSLADEGVVLRGWYDVSGLRSDADIMVWLHGGAPEDLQWALRQLRRTALLKPLIRVWSALGVHRGAEFEGDRRPAFMHDAAPGQWLSVQGLARTSEWYLIDDEDRDDMLAELAGVASEHEGVTASTVSAFALSEHEWLLALEADEVVSLVDAVRDLRSTEASDFVRAEERTFAGRRIEPAEIIEVLQ